MEADPTLMCELLVGLGDVDLVGIDVRSEDRSVGGGCPLPPTPPDL